jgi:hypothetical protein
MREYRWMARLPVVVGENAGPDHCEKTTAQQPAAA